MRTLGIFRHAKSDWDDLGKRDFDRGLNDRGRKGAALMGRHIRTHADDAGIAWTLLVASPAERVQRTLEAAALGLDPVWDRTLYLASADSIVETVKARAGDADAVLVSGHNPGLQDLLLMLVSPSNENAAFDEASIKFPTAAFAVIELDIDDWDELGGENGRIAHFKRPRDLDAELGPES